MSGSGKVSRGAAIAGLLGTTVLWGTSFATVKICGELLNSGASAGTSQAFGPLLLTALRFTAALPILFVCWKEARACWPRRGDWGPLGKVSAAMTAGFLIQAAGLAWIPATLSAFLTSLTVCLTPVLEWLILRRRTSWRLALAVALAVGAVALMTFAKPAEPGGSGGPAAAGPGWHFGAGVALTVGCALAFSFQILWTGVVAERIGAARLTVGTFGALAAVGWAVVLLRWPAEVPGAMAKAVVSPKFWGLLAVMVLGATVGAMVLMNVYQQYVRPTEAAVIYTGEPVFAGIFAWVLRGKQEALGLCGLLGAGLMLAADLLAAVRPGEKPPPEPPAPPAAPPPVSGG